MGKLSNYFKNFIVQYRTKIGHIIILLVLIFGKPNKVSLFLGLMFIILGVTIRVWAAGYIKKNEVLTIEGPYKYVRNPLYLGSFLVGTGLCICSFNLLLFLIYLATFYLIYYITIIEEEKNLRTFFKKEYEEYKKNVPCFIPKFKIKNTLKVKNCKSKWDFHVLLKNKEYEGIIWNLFGFLFLLFVYFIFEGNKSLIDFVF